jgi:chromate transporter
MMLLQLFFEFFKTGLFSVGGGLATLPFLYEISDRTGWYTHAQLADMIAISESTPGPIGVNMATYVGYSTTGILGGLVATLGLITPSIIVILVVAHFLKTYKDNKWVNAAFYGLRAASVGLIAAAGFAVLKIALLNPVAYAESGNLLQLFRWKELLLAAAVGVVLFKWKPHPILVIVAAAVGGIIFRFAGA